MGTDLVVAGTYDVALAQRTAQLVQEELGDIPISFTRVKVPSGGGVTWDDPRSEDPDSPDQVKELVGVIVGRRKTSRLYLTSFEQRDQNASSRPDAWSNDGKVQVVPPETIALAKGRGLDGPHTEVAKCPYHQYPGAGNKNPLGGFGKATNDYFELFLLLEGRPLPVQVNIPAGSIKNAESYIRDLVLVHGKKLTEVETVVSLSREKNKQDITYSQVVFRKGRLLEPGDADAAKQYEQGLKAIINDDPFANFAAVDDGAVEGVVVDGGYPSGGTPVPEAEIAGDWGTDAPVAVGATTGVDTGDLDL